MPLNVAGKDGTCFTVIGLSELLLHQMDDFIVIHVFEYILYIDSYQASNARIECCGFNNYCFPYLFDDCVFTGRLAKKEAILSIK